MLDEGDWLCLQCATYYYTGLYRRSNNDRRPQQEVRPCRQDKGISSQRLTGSFADSSVASLVTLGTMNTDFAYGQEHTSMAQLRGAGSMPLK